MVCRSSMVDAKPEVSEWETRTLWPWFDLHDSLLDVCDSSTSLLPEIPSWQVEVDHWNYIENGHKPKRPDWKCKTTTNQNGHCHNGHRTTNVWTIINRPLPTPELYTHWEWDHAPKKHASNKMLHTNLPWSQRSALYIAGLSNVYAAKLNDGIQQELL